MNKKMKEILKKIEDKKTIADNYLEEKELEKAKKVLTEIEELQKEYKVAEQLFALEKEKAAEDIEEKKSTIDSKKDSNGFKAVAKMAFQKKMTDEEKALIVESDTNSEDSNGTNYLLPEDVSLEIRELRRKYKSVVDLGLVNVVSTNSLSGSSNFETEDDGELTSFEDGEEITETSDPKFKKVPFSIKLKGALIFLSNLLAGNEKAGLVSYLDKWFVRKAVRTENREVFKVLANGKKAEDIVGLDQLKEHINTELDVSCAEVGVIITNQNGFSKMDKQKDKNGRGLLQPDPTKKTGYLFNGMPIHVFNNKDLKDVNGKSPMFVGSTVDAIDFMKYNGLLFATSEHYAFNKNQTTLRVIEGFDPVKTDANAYSYILYTGVESEEVDSVSTTPQV